MPPKTEILSVAAKGDPCRMTSFMPGNGSDRKLDRKSKAIDNDIRHTKIVNKLSRKERKICLQIDSTFSSHIAGFMRGNDQELRTLFQLL